MSKFVYEEGELHISDSVCSDCIYDKDKESCENYEHKPIEIIENKKACKFYQYPGQIML